MTKKSLLLVGVLALATLPVASAKTYTISLYEPATAGHVQLKAGQYVLAVKGSNAVFTEYRPSLYIEATEPEYGKSFTVPVKVATETQKFHRTAVVSEKKGATEQIEVIDLGGSRRELQFSN